MYPEDPGSNPVIGMKNMLAIVVFKTDQKYPYLHTSIVFIWS